MMEIKPSAAVEGKKRVRLSDRMRLHDRHRDGQDSAKARFDLHEDGH